MIHLTTSVNRSCDSLVYVEKVCAHKEEFCMKRDGGRHL